MQSAPPHSGGLHDVDGLAGVDRLCNLGDLSSARENLNTFGRRDGQHAVPVWPHRRAAVWIRRAACVSGHVQG